MYVPELKAGFWGYFAVAEKGIYFLDWAGPGNPAGLFFQGATRTQVGTVDGPPAVADSGFALSPDGRHLLYSQVDQAGSDILIMEHYRN